MRSQWTFLVAATLALQAFGIGFVSGVERLPAVPNLASFPTAIGDWTKVREDVLAEGVVKNLGADARITSTYLDRRTGLYADLLVAYFQSQRGGASQPHSPKVCLPATGWEPQEAGELTLPFPSGNITVNRFVLAGGAQRAVVTYWYQTSRRVVAGEWAAKFWLAADALRDRRSDTTLVRIFVWDGKGGDTEATEAAVRFTGSLYPLLRAHLPR
jgi:EpsI family protein